MCGTISQQKWKLEERQNEMVEKKHLQFPTYISSYFLFPMSQVPTHSFVFEHHNSYGDYKAL